jgi:hypothetical protein
MLMYIFLNTCYTDLMLKHVNYKDSFIFIWIVIYILLLSDLKTHPSTHFSLKHRIHNWSVIHRLRSGSSQFPSWSITAPT